MIAFRLLLMAFAIVAFAAPAPAQSFGGERGGGGGYQGGGGFRGGGFHGGFGRGPFFIPPGMGSDLHATEHDDDSGRHRHPRPPRKIVRSHPAPGPVIAGAPGFNLLNLPPAGEMRLLAKEILVVFRPGISEAGISAMARRQRLEIAQVRDLTLIGVRVHRFRFTDDRKVADVLTAIAREPQVAMVEPHYVFALQDDAAGAKPATLSYSEGLLHLSQAHRLATGRGVRVAVIDSEIDVAHPEIDGSVVARFDALGAVDAKPDLHGTGMASAIAGHHQIDGSAPAAQILAARVFNDDGGRAASLDVLAGIDWAAAQKAQVINMSFAGPPDPLLTKMLAAAAERKIALIAAAGNDGPTSAG